MNKESSSKKIMRRIACTLGRANTQSLFGPKSWAPQTDYTPVEPNSHEPQDLDYSPEAVSAREKSAKKSLLVPLAVILGVALILAAAILIKTNS